MNFIIIYFKLFWVILNKYQRVFGICPPGWAIFPNLYQFHGIIINHNALLYLKMVLYVNISKVVFDGGYLNIYILDIFTSFWMKTAKIIFLKY